MKQEIAEHLVAFAQEECPDCNIRLHPGYSGRGMMGKTTSAVACDHITEFTQAVAVLAFHCGFEQGCTPSAFHFSIADLMDDLQNLRQDSLGKGIVVY